MQRSLKHFRALWTYLFCWMKNYSCPSTITIHPEKTFQFFLSFPCHHHQDIEQHPTASQHLYNYNIRDADLFSFEDEKLLIENHFTIHLVSHSLSLSLLKIVLVCLFVFERENARPSQGGAEVERGRKSQAGSTLSMEPDTGIDPMILGSWPELKWGVQHWPLSHPGTPNVSFSILN